METALDLDLKTEPDAAFPSDREDLLRMLRTAQQRYLSVDATGPEDDAVVTVENLEVEGLRLDVVFRFAPVSGALRSVSLRRG